MARPASIVLKGKLYSAETLGQLLGVDMTTAHYAYRQVKADSGPNVTITALRHALQHRISVQHFRDEARYEEMVTMREQGCTYQEIGDEFGVSRQRAEQIVRRKR